MRILISGGVKMGKSTLAQQLAAAQGGRRVYIATMVPRDAEDEARVVRHRVARAGWGFRTVERDHDIGALAGTFAPGASLLMDSTTALLASEMFGADGALDEGAPARVAQGLLALLDSVENIVVVSDAIYADAMRYDASTEAYRRGLAAIDRALAARCGAVIEMVYGQAIMHKGDEGLAGWLAESGARFCDGDGAVHGPAGIRPLG